ncbi:MAG: alpha/beta fold hydrolase [Geminicoccaceae bacterium]
MQRNRTVIKAGGRNLALQQLQPEGARNGPTLVFLHEGLGSIALWRDFPTRLCERLGLPGLVYDRWGHGQSEPLDRPRGLRYLHDEADLFLPAVLETAGVAEPVLIGHSDGGTIALLYAARFPERPPAIVTEAAHVFVEDITVAGIQAAGRAYAETDLATRLARYHGEKTDKLFRAWHDRWLSPAFRAWNIEAELASIICPALVLQGEADQYGTQAQVDAIARAVAGPVETVLLPGIGHAPHQEAPAQVLELIEGFLRRCLDLD